MTDPEATLQAAPAADLRAIVANTADVDLRTAARAELARRQAGSQRRHADRSTAREVVLQKPAPKPSRAEIRAARRFAVVTYDGRRLS